jgi:hypothetical protein
MITTRNVWFHENCYGIKLLNTYFVFLQDYHFDFVSDFGALIPLLSPSIRLSNSIPISTRH